MAEQEVKIIIGNVAHVVIVCDYDLEDDGESAAFMDGSEEAIRAIHARAPGILELPGCQLHNVTYDEPMREEAEPDRWVLHFEWDWKQVIT